jgi:geranylgeranyl pyrophosphate synthase
VKLLPIPMQLPRALAALDRASRPGGASPLPADVPNDIWRRALIGPAAEFLARPGKELRTTIVEMGWTLGGGAPGAMPDRLPLVIELLHAGSLIIDDVEDGSEMRRGAPALHRIVGTPIAINTGSWMYFWALAELEQLALAPAVELAAHRATTRTLVRCHQGQALDLAIPVTELQSHEVAPVVETTTRLKTGALCALAAQLGAIVAGGAPAIAQSVGRFGERMGIALQMLDDLGSLTSPARRDKGHEDLRAARPTWPWAWLAQRDAFAWARGITSARAVLAGNGDLDALADLLAREVADSGRVCIRATLDATVAELTAIAGETTITHRFAAELRRMESRYG